MASEWSKLTQLTGGRPFRVERVRLVDEEIALEGDFEPSPLARLTANDQAFVAAFVHCHGSIKQMETWFGISYPTVKNRLRRIAESLDFAEFDADPGQARTGAVLDLLERGEVTVDEALEALER